MFDVCSAIRAKPQPGRASVTSTERAPNQSRLKGRQTMAIHKPTRSPRRAQLQNSGLQRNRRRLMKPVERLPVYENLFALNRDFEQVLADFARLQELGVFKRDLGNIFHIVLQETRCWANLELFEFLKLRERDDWARLGRLRHQWENELE